MAQIAVERKSSSAWVWWLLAAIIIAALLWFFIGRDRDTYPAAAATSTAAEATSSMASNTGALTSLAPLLNPADSSLAGRQVAITDPVRVLSVTGDKTFWVGQGTGQQALVFLEEVPTPNQPAIEGRYDITPGQTVKIWGDVRSMPSFDVAQRDWKASPSLRQEYEQQKVYIHANRLEVASRP